MELTSPRLSDIQYINLPIASKKKWIGLQMDLTANMIEGSEPEVINYIKKEKY